MSNKLERMPGTKLSPEFLVRTLLEHIDKIEGIACVVQWKGEEFQACNSAMKTTTLAAMGAFLGATTMDEFRSRDE